MVVWLFPRQLLPFLLVFLRVLGSLLLLGFVLVAHVIADLRMADERERKRDRRCVVGVG